MENSIPKQFRWIANDIDVSELTDKLPSYMLEMISEIENADTENNLPVYVQVCDDFEIYAKMLVPDVLSMEEWHRFCAKYSLPE
ncbi:MAG: hypothetical protein PUB89_12965 [Oscillospiraceae bacterium]|nr:hypothetical protein [Oscillospiraceae bacterium]